MRIESRRFGTFELEESRLIDLGGLPGFPSARRFALLGRDRSDAFAWLICADVPDLAFAVTDPWQFCAAYAPAVPSRRLDPWTRPAAATERRPADGPAELVDRGLGGRDRIERASGPRGSRVRHDQVRGIDPLAAFAREHAATWR